MSSSTPGAGARTAGDEDMVPKRCLFVSMHKEREMSKFQNDFLLALLHHKSEATWWTLL
jgi:hypothetical protein